MTFAFRSREPGVRWDAVETRCVNGMVEDHSRIPPMMFS